MKIRHLLDKMGVAELSNLIISSDIDEENPRPVLEKYYPKLLVYINESLLRLHSRYLLREKEVLIQLKENITHYYLRKEFAESYRAYVSESLYDREDVSFPYIKDFKNDPFVEDVIRIIDTYSSVGLRLPLNDPCEEFSLFTPQPDLLQVPRPVDGTSISVHYQAKHEELFLFSENYDKFLEQEINIPAYLEEALRSYIAYKVYTHMNAQDSTAKGQEYLQLYEALCAEIDQRDLTNQTQFFSHTKLQERGFV